MSVGNVLSVILRVSMPFDEERAREQADPGKEGKGSQLFCQGKINAPL